MEEVNSLPEDGSAMSSEDSEQCYSTSEVLEDRYCTSSEESEVRYSQSSEESEVWYSKPSEDSEAQCSNPKDLERYKTSEDLDRHRKPFQYLDWYRKASADRYNKSPKEFEIRYSKSFKDLEVQYSKSKDSEVLYTNHSKDSEVQYDKPSGDSELQHSKSSKESEVRFSKPSEDKKVRNSRSSKKSEVRYNKSCEDSKVQYGKSRDSEVRYNKPSEDSVIRYSKSFKDSQEWFSKSCEDSEVRYSKSCEDSEVRYSKSCEDSEVRYSKSCEDSEVRYSKSCEDSEVRYSKSCEDSEVRYSKSCKGVEVRCSKSRKGLEIQYSKPSRKLTVKFIKSFRKLEWYRTAHKNSKSFEKTFRKIDFKPDYNVIMELICMGPRPYFFNWMESEIGNVSSFMKDFRRLSKLPSPSCWDDPLGELQESQQSCTVHGGNSKDVPQSPEDYVIVKLNEVLGKEVTILTLNAVAFTPPVTVLRTNTIKGNRKLLWRDLESHDVSCWMPRWSAVIIIYQSIHSENCFVAEMISQGRCIILYERQWQKIEVEPWCWDKNIYNAGKEKPAQNTGNRKVTEGEATTHNVGELTLYYSAQGSISTLVVMALAPKEGEDVLELCATSSGKTSHIGAIMMNTGTLIANALRDDDVNVIEENNRLLGVNNCIVMSVSAAAMAREEAGSFNRILVDAPSSGVGVVSTDSSSKVFHRAKGLQICSNIQENLIINGVTCLKEEMYHNSYLLYTTCSVLVEENECVVDFILKKYPKLELVPTGIGIGFPGFTYFQGQRFYRKMHYTRRIYCHQHHIDGAFLAKFMLKSKRKMNGDSEKQICTKTSKNYNMLYMWYLSQEVMKIRDDYENNIQKEEDKEARRRKKRKRKRA